MSTTLLFADHTRPDGYDLSDRALKTRMGNVVVRGCVTAPSHR